MIMIIIIIITIVIIILMMQAPKNFALTAMRVKDNGKHLQKYNLFYHESSNFNNFLLITAMNIFSG